MEAAVNGGGSNGIFATTVNAMTGWWQWHQLPLDSWGWQPALPLPPLAKEAIATDAIASLPLHPTATSINDNLRQQRPPSLLLPLTTAFINDYCHCCRQQQTTTLGFWRLQLLTV
jgi:hypothetical protein